MSPALDAAIAAAFTAGAKLLAAHAERISLDNQATKDAQARAAESRSDQQRRDR